MNGLGSGDLIVVGQKLSVPASNSAPALSPANASSYTTQADDTLYRIALRYGVSMRDLARINDLPNPNLLSTGQVLVIPKSDTMIKPGLIADSPTARQGGTLLLQIARPEMSEIAATVGGKTIPLTRAGGYFYGLVGISRCAKLASFSIALNETDRSGGSSTESMPITVASTAFPLDAINLPPAKAAILSDAAAVQRENVQVAAIAAKYTPTRLWSGAFRQPINAKVTEYFGTRRSYNGGAVNPCGHEGTDFGAATGTPVFSDARGRVIFAGPTQVRGSLVIVDHGLGVMTAYYHLSEIGVQVGQMVEGGTAIGKVGSTGLSTGPHLHWSVLVNGEYVDPMEWTRRVLP
jgi:murein DD-endopeptidase MepM/ murein hydrolase activator NlpD